MDSQRKDIPKGKRRSVWCDGDTHMLLELWAERAADLRRAKRNGHIYKDISVQMDNKFTPEEVHVKIRNFTQKYREEKKEMRLFGGASNWKFYKDVHRIIGSNADNSAEVSETFSFVNKPEASGQSSLESQPLPATDCSGRKRTHLGEVVKIMKEQNVMLKSVVEDSQLLSKEIVNAIQEQNETSKEFINLMKTLIHKI